MQGKRGSFTFIGRNGWSLNVPRRMLPTYKECFFDATYTKGFPIDFPSPDIVVDIGANVGYFSFSVFAQFPNVRVLAYEPIATNFQLLQQYHSQHPQLDFHIFHQAVNGDGEPLVLHYDEGDAFTTAATLFDKADQPHTITVPATTLSAIMEANQLTAIDWLKLDCEGAEYAILYQTPPAILQQVRLLSVETHAGPTQAQQQPALAAYLTQQGFTIHQKGSKIWGYR